MMENPRRLLPPMAALHSFAAAARLSSFSKAANEVGLTQSAISRQIAHLEDWLEIRLFDRIGRRVTLTAEGKTYAAVIEPALGRIRHATALALKRHPAREITIATLPSFGMRWLAPRLPRLTALYPDLIVNFAARSTKFDFTKERFDAAIHFGKPDWSGVAHDRLFTETAIPVCSPKMLEAHPVSQPSDFLGLPLLFQAYRLEAWTTWFGQAGVVTDGSVSGSRFEHFLMLAQAAVAGAGAALIPSFLIEPELSSGLLVAPINLPLLADDAYYLVYPPEGLRNPFFEQLRDWLIAEATAL